MKTTEKFVFFWDGIYSQWYYSPMRIDGFEYSTCEQYMMHQKAVLFNDITAAKQILMTESPAEQKAIGRQVENFNRDIWDQYCMSIVINGNYHKFKQNPMLGKELRMTDIKIIVKASPTDKIWGIGMKEDDPGIEDPANWKGLNLLGNAIMNVRSLLILESYGVN